ncbi:MAG: AAA family ATPase [bacterium]
MNTKQQLPIGISTLSEIINSHFLYIDKTEVIHRLITTNRRCFLSRPRRFGKSMLISTIKEIFLGNQGLFKNLWIGQEGRHAWVKHPVIHIDFSELDSATPESLKEGLCLALESIAHDYNTTLNAARSPDAKLSLLARHIASITPAKLAILIDEYDAPLLKHIDNPELAQTMRDVLSSFYATIKALDPYIHFTFVTGVTKFAKTSLFSGANNLNDISLETQFSSLCGYTEDEIHENLSTYIQEHAASKGTTPSTIIEEMRTWYNGYQFSYERTKKIYNPYSVLLYLHKHQLANYWFASGTPTFLIKLIQENLYDFAHIDHSYADSNMLETFEANSIPLTTLLYQTGYLTIEKYSQEDRLYTLTYPNEEVRQSLNHSLIKSTLAIKTSTQVTANSLRNALKTENIPAFQSALQSLFAHIPHQLHVEREAFYHALLQMICYILGADIASEVSVSTGRIDMIIHTQSTVYIFELKLNQSADIALSQIKERRYYEKYLTSTKKILLVGLNFEYETKHITAEWEAVHSKNLL